VWKFAAKLFQEKHYKLSKLLYEIYIKAKPNDLEVMGQYVSIKHTF